MLRIFFILIIGLCFSISHAATDIAQDHTNLSDAINSVLQDRKEAISETLALSESEQRSFWPVYADYENEMSIIMRDTARLMDQLSTKSGVLSAEQADILIDQLLSTQKRSVEVQNQFIKKFRSILPPDKLAVFIGILFWF